MREWTPKRVLGSSTQEPLVLSEQRAIIVLDFLRLLGCVKWWSI